jgi:hypothetical protein
MVMNQIPDYRDQIKYCGYAVYTHNGKKDVLIKSKLWILKNLIRYIKRTEIRTYAQVISTGLQSIIFVYSAAGIFMLIFLLFTFYLRYIASSLLVLLYFLLVIIYAFFPLLHPVDKDCVQFYPKLI